MVGFSARMAHANSDKPSKVWLVCNESSGSNDDAAVTALVEAFDAAGFDLDRILRFPDEPAPQPAQLDAEEVAILCVFGGDGTTHSVVANASGWNGGAVLVLPGGTMNLLAKRMQRFRAVASRSEGTRISLNVAPATSRCRW